MHENIEKKLHSGWAVPDSIYFEFPLNAESPLAVEMTSNSRKYLFLIDTGSSVTLVSEDAECFTVESDRGNIKLMGLSGENSRENQFAKMKNLMLENIPIEDLYCIVTDLSHIEINGIKYDGILGENFLKKFRLVIDYPNERFILTNKKSEICIGDRHIPFKMENDFRSSYFNLEIDTGVQVPAFIDTGTDLTCTPERYIDQETVFHNEYLELSGISNRGKPYELGKIRSLYFGDAVINMLTTVASYSSRLLFGRDFLELSKIEIDYINDRISFNLSNDQDQFKNIVYFSEIVFEKDNSGFIVKDLWSESFLSELGVVSGDFIIEIDDISISDYPSVIDLYLFFGDSRIHKIALIRKGERIILDF
ncbi:MAG: aspartyl protease family protein [Spirochaetales bacterium]|nr:aspartyl protease family protein [Spirochaetales bacterium]